MEDALTNQHNAHVATIAAAYLGNPSNPIDRDQIADVIRQIDAALKGPSQAEASAATEIEKPTAAAIRKSITPDHLVSFVDGKPYKTLRRHLATHGHTPESYRERYGLKPDYPMTAPSYSAMRSAFAKERGLGQSQRMRSSEVSAGANKRLEAAAAAPATEISSPLAEVSEMVRTKPTRSTSAEARPPASKREAKKAPLSKPASTDVAAPVEEAAPPVFKRTGKQGTVSKPVLADATTTVDNGASTALKKAPSRAKASEAKPTKATAPKTTPAKPTPRKRT